MLLKTIFSKKLTIFISLVVIILGALGFYFLYWIKTPAYSLNLIRESIQNHDVATFEKHVDLDTLYDKAFDDALIAYSKVENKADLSDPFVMGMFRMMKPPVISELKRQTLDAIKPKDPEEKKVPKQPSDSEAMAGILTDNAGAHDVDIKDMTVISNDGTESLVSVKLHNERLGKDFDLRLQMNKLDDGTWKVKKIDNLVDFLIAVDTAEKEKLAEINKPIREEIANAVNANSSLSLDMQGEYFISYTARFAINLENKTDKDIRLLEGTIDILDSDDKVIKTANFSYGKNTLKAHEKATITHSEPLNQFIKEDRVLIDNPTNKKIVVNISKLMYADGTTIKLHIIVPKPNKKK